MKNLINSILARFSHVKKSTIVKISFILTGIISTAWFLVRVIPKPSRATYPCMRAAAPVMSGFVVYLLTLAGSLAAYRKAKMLILRSKYTYGILFALVAFAGLLFFTSRENGNANPSDTADWVIVPNQPVGMGKGIFPGRVVWVHDPEVTSWNCKTCDWWDDTVLLQTETDKMFKESLTALTGKDNEKEAWDDLFRKFNSDHKKGDQPYREGEKVAVKINENNTYSHKDSPEINATPQLVLSLIKSLVNEAGISQENITVFDASRFITDNIYNKCHAVFPGVAFVDNVGGDGRVKST
ncbi:MAG TPA: hypothetical protein VJ963_03430, partial [Bacteroidales bacterium]|nr:hypothetical protein [Bacteroidales bacterium]